MGSKQAPLARRTDGNPTVILLAGLQGTGKTTAAAKLAKCVPTYSMPICFFGSAGATKGHISTRSKSTPDLCCGRKCRSPISEQFLGRSNHVKGLGVSKQCRGLGAVMKNRIMSPSPWIGEQYIPCTVPQNRTHLNLEKAQLDLHQLELIEM